MIVPAGKFKLPQQVCGHKSAPHAFTSQSAAPNSFFSIDFICDFYAVSGVAITLPLKI